MGCIEFCISQFEAVYHYIAMKQRAQTHADCKLSGVGNSIGYVAKGVVGLGSNESVDGQV